MSKPTAIRVDPDAIPADLQALPRWLCWSYKLRDGKWAKVPMRADGRGAASSSDPSTWCNFDEAVGAYLLGDFDGIGIALGGGLCGLDLDDHRDPSTGDLDSVAQDALGSVPGYWEVSPSGTGLKGLFYTGLVKSVARAKKLGIEFYAGGRYFAITGQPVQVDPHGPEDDRSEAVQGFLSRHVGERSATVDDVLESEMADQQPLDDWSLEDVLQYILPHLDEEWRESYEQWLTVGQALHHQGRGGAEWLQAWDDWSVEGSTYGEGVCADKWASFGRPSSGQAVRSLRTLIKAAGNRRPRVAMTGQECFGDIEDDPQELQQQSQAAVALQAQDREAVLAKAKSAIEAEADATHMERVLAPKLAVLDWTDAERSRLAKALQDRFKQLTGSSLPAQTARGWLQPPVQAQAGMPDVNSDGKPQLTHRNVQYVLSRSGVVVRYNVIKKEDEILIPSAAFSQDNAANASLAAILSECHAADMKIQSSTLKQYLTLLADQNQYNPALTWITSRPWDGVDRLQDWYDTVKAQEGHTRLKETLMRRWALQAVAVLFNTGDVQARGVLTFQGVQYQGKTRWLKSLAPDGLVNVGHILDVHNKDHVKIAISYWMTELGEIDATFKRSDLAALKSFISQQTDTFRRPYAAAEGSYPRRTVFFASVNDKQFLRDPTGNTRYWVIPVESIATDHTVEMQQLWAQVLHLQQGGERHWLSPEEMTLLNEANEEFTVADPVEEMLRDKLPWDEEGAEWGWMTATNVAEMIGIQRPGQHEVSRIGSAVRKLNGQRAKRSNGKTLLWTPIKRPLGHDW